MHSEIVLEPDVQNWIEHICEPQRLLLAWQAPDQFGNRFRWAVGEISRTKDDYLFRYFEGPEFESFNQGKSYSKLLSMGYHGYPAFDPREINHTRNVLAPFLRRLASRGRSDFDAYTRYYHLHPDVQISDFALLGITEAKLPSDGFSLVNTLDEAAPSCDLFLEVAGHRYYRENLPGGSLIGKSVELIPEPNNKHDPNAVMVRLHKKCIGYINRLQTRTFKAWISEDRVSALIERLNGDIDRPRLFIFVRVKPRRQERVA
jgi:hypothetical protein